jgi:hypothetical protein
MNLLSVLPRLLACLAFVGAATSALHAQPRAEKPLPFAPATATQRVVYRAASLIDGNGGPVRRDMAVVTVGPRIEAVVESHALTPELTKGAEIVDLGGAYLLPGLIDDHQHLATPPDARTARAQMRRDVYSGITAVRIMADDLRSIAELNREAVLGEIPGPDLYFAALMAGQSFFDDPRTAAAARGFTPGTVPWMQVITDKTDIRTAVSIARGTGAMAIKIYANLPPALVKRIAAEAHRQGLRVWAHGMVFPTPPAQVIAAGPDVISHTCYLAYQLSDPRPQSYQDRFPVDYAKFEGGDNAEMAKLFAEMKRRDIILDPTLRVYRESDERAAKSPGGKPYHCTLDLAARLTDQARRAGVQISAGTDGFTAWDAPYPALYDELELLATRANMPPAEVIRTATLIGARTIGRDKDMGSVEPGKIANLLVVDRNPLDLLANLRSVRFAVKQGRRYDRADYRPITRDEISAKD